MSVNNYEQWRIDWQRRFLSMDISALLHKLPFLKIRADRLWVPYFHQLCSICLSDGVIEPPNAWGQLSLMDEMNIYTLLWYSKENARLTKVWQPFEQLRSAAPFGPAFRKGNLAPLAATFSGHAHELTKALLSLGGLKLPTGDVGYQINVFPCIPLRVLFWEGDEEFPAQANLLFDRSATDFMRVESLVSMASGALRHLAEEAGLPIKGAIIEAK